eukprot:CAMPEP_0205811398 /NCGR_PEP_ID=MMETSP0205-20121125/15577_1 /ASSEMBLY_ACC=CAM_ASM_000278 /TAXON_ID=36767 /ORGANISM="Euplotes focardii, Strain TN1" /LENGTH=85 /DNA_ID=CAMNT_0053090487 /DNA_START=747 /DNA_END=1002 /DNA_ORIENTATION=-
MIRGKDQAITDKASGTALTILSKPIEIKPDFEFEIEQIEAEMKKNKLSYNHNPPFWGPGKMATNNSVPRPTKKAEIKALEKEEEN